MGIHVAKAIPGRPLPTGWARAAVTGLRTVPSVIYPAAAEAKHHPMVALAASIKTTLYVGILLSLACGDAE